MRICAIFLLWASSVWADPARHALQLCLSCHVIDAPAEAEPQIDIVGLQAIEALPPEWQFMFEDSFDLNDDGISGRMRMVSGDTMPLVAKYGSKLAAARFEDFAKIAGAAHDIVMPDQAGMQYIKQGFLNRSPAPKSPFRDAAHQRSFERRGCASCHVTRRFLIGGKDVMPLSDFLLHDMGQGLRRTKPLWSCPDCVAEGTDPHQTPLPPRFDRQR